MRAAAIAAALVLTLGTGAARAQMIVSDPTNLAQSIVNTTRNVVQTSSTAANMLKAFEETQKIYQQGKAYYDSLRQVSDLVRSARKVQQTILLAGEITEEYVSGFQDMLQGGLYSVEELSAVAAGYAALIEQGYGILTDLRQVVDISTLQLTDRDRMDTVDDCYDRMVSLRSLAAYYSRRSLSLGYIRSGGSTLHDSIFGTR